MTHNKISVTFSKAAVCPSTEQMKPFIDIPTGWISDALGRRASLSHHIKAMTKSKKFVGSALTIATPCDDNLGLYAALSVVQPGNVLVVATLPANGPPADCSVCGDILAGFAKNAGAVGLVTDGLVRDQTGLNDLELPVFATGLSANAPAKNGGAIIGEPVNIGNKIVRPGDVICADEDGVVVIGSQDLDQIEHALRDIRAKEDKMMHLINNGAHKPDWLDERLAREDIYFKSD